MLKATSDKRAGGDSAIYRLSEKLASNPPSDAVRHEKLIAAAVSKRRKSSATAPSNVQLNFTVQRQAATALTVVHVGGRPLRADEWLK